LHGRTHRVRRVSGSQRIQPVGGPLSEAFDITTEAGEEFRLVHQMADDSWWVEAVK